LELREARMARNVAMTVPARPENTQPMAEKLKLEYAIKTITPIFGGGVDPGKSDPVSVVRVPAIRGHLRFWWRAVRGSQSGLTVSALRKREAEIWGSASVPSAVVVEVKVTNPGKSVDWAHYAPNARGTEVLQVHDGYPGYALFPFQRNLQEDKPLDKALSGVTFNLTIWAPAVLKPDIEAAVWAWLNFGGIGARTRRGCGALFCQELAPATASPAVLRSWFNNRLAGYQPNPAGTDLKWPTLRLPPLAHPASQTPMAAWVRAVEAMGNYRQKPGTGRNRGTRSQFGRSFWPEPDSFRSLAPRCAHRDHKTSFTIDPALPPLFPRALFGLPIIFQMKSDPAFGPVIELNPAVPGDREGDWKPLKRMASPLVLRPLAFGDGRQAIAMILRLQADEPVGVVLKNNNLPTKGWDTTHLTGPRTLGLEGSPLGYARSPIMSAQGDALSGFVDYVLDVEGFVAL